MTYRAEMHRLAEAVSTLLINGGTVPGDDLRAALAGHLALVELLDTVHRDLAPHSVAAVKDTISALDQDPVPALGRLLRLHPRQLDQPISDVLSTDAASPAGRAWRDVAAAATVAQHDWQTANTLTRPRGDAAWAEMADVAALSQAVAMLDSDIADSLSSVARWQEAAVYRAAAHSGLRIAAHEVRCLAAAGPLPGAAELVADPGRKVLVVRRPTDLPAALTRLGHLAATSTDISPAHIALAGRTVAEASLTAASTFESLGDTATAAELRHQAARLAAASGMTRRVASLHPGDGQALAQANVIHQFMTGMRERRQGFNPEIAAAVATAVSSASTALGEAVDQQVSQARWLVQRSEGRSSSEWGPVRGVWEAPQLHTAMPDARPTSSSIVRPLHIPSSPRAQLNNGLREGTAMRTTRPSGVSPSPGRPRS